MRDGKRGNDDNTSKVTNGYMTTTGMEVNDGNGNRASAAIVTSYQR